ncbi:hypothetical protein BU15DRAFT_88520 [Melanogaster broomeanus]|nr:hypothetical protein BU15DRAFT_88520 [Melanogaster broomeanus]
MNCQWCPPTPSFSSSLLPVLLRSVSLTTISSFQMTRSRLLPTTHHVLTQDDDPLDLLYHRFNVAKATLQPGVPIPSTIDLRVLKDAHIPSHVLAVFDVPENEWEPSYRPILVPIRTDLYTRDFRTNIIPPSPPGTPYPIPYSCPTLRQANLVPHAPSIPLLFLFALGLESRSHLFCCRLLPSEVIGEFPAPPAMAQSMSELCSDSQLAQYITFNQGLWRNILSLCPRDTQFVELVQTAWNVTVEARRIRRRAAVDIHTQAPDY